jgi:hypothetical protein
MLAQTPVVALVFGVGVHPPYISERRYRLPPPSLA